MNERIRELAEQATRNVESANSYHSLVFDREKFAELIVRECAKVAKRHTPDYEELDYSHLIGDKIKQHFGVEE